MTASGQLRHGSAAWFEMVGEVMGATAEHFRRSGAMRVKGDLSKLGDWLQFVHDPIVARTI